MTAKEEDGNFNQGDIFSCRHNGYVGKKVKHTFAPQLGLQLLMLITELLMRQKEFLIQLGPSIGAKLKRGNAIVSHFEDSSRVIFTRRSRVSLTQPESRGLGIESI